MENRRSKDPGRREYDFRDRCPLCEIKDERNKERWDKIKEEQKERQEICNGVASEIKHRIERMEDAQKSFVLWRSFAIIVTLATLFVSGGFGLLWKSIGDGQRDVKESLSVIHRRVSETNTEVDHIGNKMTEALVNQNLMSTRLTQIEQRIDNKKP